MKEMDNVQVIAEKEGYAREGVHKGMYGWICDERTTGGTWLVNFPQVREHSDIATIAIREEDMKKVPILYADINEEIRARYEAQSETPADPASGT